jgi:hypothetical protein
VAWFFLCLFEAAPIEGACYMIAVGFRAWRFGTG